MRYLKSPSVLARGVVGVVLMHAALCSAAQAQEVRLGDLKAQFFLESSGKLSEDVLTRTNPKLMNLPRGEGEFSEPVNTVVVTVGLIGQKNTQPKFASGIVNITTTNRTGQRKTETRALLGFVFGESGMVYRAITLDNVTCSKVEVEVKLRNASKRASLPFECTDPKEEPVAKAPAANTSSTGTRPVR